jgi:hypothetical protein
VEEGSGRKGLKAAVTDWANGNDDCPALKASQQQTMSTPTPEHTNISKRFKGISLLFFLFLWWHWGLDSRLCTW